MSELMKINTDNEDITLSARELHEFLEVGTEYPIWFERMKEYGFSESVDFNSFKKEEVRIEGCREVKRTIIDHEIKLDMAKEIAMIQRNEKGKQARQYFLKIEKEWNSPEKIMARALTIANKTIGSLNNTVKLMKPKAEFYDDVAGSKDSIEMGQVAKVLAIKGVGRNKLFELLRDKKVLDKRNIPYQTYVDRGYFRVLEQKYTTGSETKINIKTLVFQKGVDYIRKIIKEAI